MDNIRIEHVSGAQGLRSIRDRWLELTERLDNGAFYQHYYFFESFLEGFDDGKTDYYFFTLYKGETLIGVIPLRQIRLKCFGLKIAALEIPWDYDVALCDIIVEDDSIPVFNLIFEYCRRVGIPVDVVRGKFVLQNAHLLSVLANQSETRYLTIFQAVNDYLERQQIELVYAKSKKKSRSVYRKQQKLRKLGEVQFVTANATDDIESAYRDLLEIENSGWKNRAGSATEFYPMSKVFFAKLVENFSKIGACTITSLKLDGKTIASKLSVVLNDRCYYLKIGYDETYAKMSPGVLLIENVLASLAENTGVKEYNFITHHDYYQQWDPMHAKKYEVYVPAGTTRGRLAHYWFSCKKLLRRDPDHLTMI